MNPTPDKYISEQQQRLIRVALSLAGHEFEGITPGDIATASGAQPSQVTRDLANLKHAGWAEQLPNSTRWRLGPSFVHIGLRYLTGVDRAERRLGEVKSRFGSAAISSTADNQG